MHRVWRGRERFLRGGPAPAAILLTAALMVAPTTGAMPGDAARAAPRAVSPARTTGVTDAQPPTVERGELLTPAAYRCGVRDTPRFPATALLGSGLAAREPGAAGDAIRAAIDDAGDRVPSDGWHVVAADETTRWVVSAPVAGMRGPDRERGERRLFGLAMAADGTWSTVVNEPCVVELAAPDARAVPWSLVPEGWLSRARDRLDVLVELPCEAAADGRFVRYRPGTVMVAEAPELVHLAPTLVPAGTRPRCRPGATLRLRLPVVPAGRTLVDVARPQWATRWGPTLPGTTPPAPTPSAGPWPAAIRDVAYHCDGGGPTFPARWTQQAHEAQARTDEIGAIIRRWVSTETSWPATGYRVRQVAPDELLVLGRATPPDGSWWVSARIEREDGAWGEIRGYGDCTPRAAARDSVHLTWTLDPAFPVRPADRVLHLRLQLPRCFESIYPADWAAQRPIVREDERAVYLIVGARMIDADRCRGNLVLRQTARLSRPLGDRAVVNANVLPPVTIRP